MRHLYAPRQPTAGCHGENQVQYREFLPPETLNAVVYCYWELWSARSLDQPYPYAIVSDGCVDLLLDCNVFEGVLIAGTTSTAAQVSLAPGFRYFGIRFFPGVATQLLSLPMTHFSDAMTLASTIDSARFDTFEKKLFEASDTAKRISVANQFLQQQLRHNNTCVDHRLLAVLSQTYQRRGDLPTGEMTNVAGIGQRHLRRLFNVHLGISPKNFARIVRFQSALQMMTQLPPTQWGFAAHQLGYYDQAHFIREFNTHFGSSPLKSGMANPI